MKIGLLSDTHGWLDERVLKFFQGCEEAWHCGDIGDASIIDRLEEQFRVRAVYGNRCVIAWTVRWCLSVKG